MGHSSSILFLFLVLATVGAQVNRTIDDTYGDSKTHVVPVYAPSGSWDGTDCSSCAIQPSTEDAFNGTWTAATYNPTLGSTNITFYFEGSAIYVYFILANNEGNGITTRTACNFTIDGELAGSFDHTASDSTELEYNALVHSSTTLSMTNHSMVISTTGVDYGVFINFDYAIYTYDEGASSTFSGTSPAPTTASESDSGSGSAPDKKNRTGAIIGGAVGGIVIGLLIAAGAFFCWWRRHRARSAQVNEGSPSAFMSKYGNDYVEGHHQPTSFYRPGDGERSSIYIPDNVMSALPDGGIMMSAATPPDARSLSDAIPPNTSSPATFSTSEIRRTRQQALEAQMRQIQAEMVMLTEGTKQGGPSTSTPSGQEEDVNVLRGQITAMREQMRVLQSQQQSAWAQGLSDEPPPGYTPEAEGEAAVPQPRQPSEKR